MAIAAQPPATPKKPVTDEYHGVKVVDDYRWLEDRSDPAVQAWSADENAYARRYLDALPGRPALYEQLKQLYTQASARYAKLHYRSGVLFAMKFQPPKEQPALVALRSADDPGSESVIVDPNRLDATGGTSIDFYTASTDGKYVAVSLSKGGSESGDVYIYETADGRPSMTSFRGLTAAPLAAAWHGMRMAPDFTTRDTPEPESVQAPT
jgi:prolyl oligopeptidase